MWLRDQEKEVEDEENKRSRRSPKTRRSLVQSRFLVENLSRDECRERFFEANWGRATKVC